MIKQLIVNFAKKTLSEGLRIKLRKLNWKRLYLMQTMFSSDNQASVFCPIANKEYKRFIKLGSHLVSPENGARNRQRLVWLYLTKELGILEKGMRVLHIAPELSYNKILREQKNLKYIAGDKMVDGYSNQAGIQDVDLTGLPFEGGSFDLIICNHVLEHIPEDAKAMTEIYRVLSKGGTAIVTVPINEDLKETYEDASIQSPRDRLKHFGQWDHVRWYGVDIKNRFENAQFKAEVNRYGSDFSEEDYAKYGLCEDLIVVAKKQ